MQGGSTTGQISYQGGQYVAGAIHITLHRKPMPLAKPLLQLIMSTNNLLQLQLIHMNNLLVLRTMNSLLRTPMNNLLLLTPMKNKVAIIKIMSIRHIQAIKVLSLANQDTYDASIIINQSIHQNNDLTY